LISSEKEVLRAVNFVIALKIHSTFTLSR